MIQNVNFMAKMPPVNKIAEATKADAEKFFAHSTPIKNVELPKFPSGLTEAEIKGYLAAKTNIPTENASAVKKAQAKLAEDSYRLSHGNPVE